MATTLLRAQSLDNTATDPFAIDRSLLPSDDVTGRQRVSSTISALTGKKEPGYESETAALWTSHEGTVVRVLTEERDRAGRGAPIVCHVQSGDVEEAVEAASEAIQWFAGEIGRTVAPARIDEVRRAASGMARKKKTYQATATISLIAVLIALLTWLASRPS